MISTKEAVKTGGTVVMFRYSAFSSLTFFRVLARLVPIVLILALAFLRGRSQWMFVSAGSPVKFNVVHLGKDNRR